mgnify:FL=1
MNREKYMSYLLKKYVPKNYKNKSYSWKEFKRRHKIINYLFHKKFKGVNYEN